MFCLDATFVIDYVDGVEATREFHDRHSTGAYYVPTVVLFEFYRGEIGPRSSTTLADLRRALDWTRELPFTDSAAGEAAEIETELMARDEGIGARDTMIAGTVREADGTIVTRNAGHFERVDGLDVRTY